MTVEDRIGDEAREAAALPDAPEPPARRRRRTFGALLIAAAAIAVVALAAHVYWQRGARDAGRGVPLLRAEPGPARERPSDPGGMTVPWRDLLALHELGAPEDETGEPVVERLLPPPEAPLPRPRRAEAPPNTAPTPAGADGIGEAPEAPDTSILVETDAAGEALENPPAPALAGAGGADEAPEVPIAPILVEADPTGDALEIPDAPTLAEAGGGGETPAIPDAPVSAEADAGEAPKSAGAGETPPAPAQKPEPPLQQEAAAAASRPPPQTMEDILALAAETGDAVFDASFAVQLGAYRTEAEAEQAWDNAFERAPEVLGPAPHYIAQADLGAGAGVVHRLRIGPLPGRESAETLCRDLRSVEIACFTVAP